LALGEDYDLAIASVVAPKGVSEDEEEDAAAAAAASAEDAEDEAEGDSED
jgi:hypothetical protein